MSNAINFDGSRFRANPARIAAHTARANALDKCAAPHPERMGIRAVQPPHLTIQPNEELDSIIRLRPLLQKYA